MNNTERTRFLRELTCFQRLDDDALGAVADACEEEHFAAQDVVFAKGERAREMRAVVQGRLELADDQEEELLLRRGDVTTLSPLFQQSQYKQTATALEDTLLLKLDRSHFENVIGSRPAVALALLAFVNDKVNCAQCPLRRCAAAREVGEGPLRIVFFDSKPYTRQTFHEQNAEFGFDIRFLEPRLGSDTVFLARGADAVCVFVNDVVDRTVVEALSRMGIGLIALRCAGFNNVDVDACREHEISVIRVPAYSPHAVAEHTVGLMLSLNRRIHLANNRVRQGNFALDGLVGFDMNGRTAGVVGTGKIGRCVIRILKGLGCRVVAYDKFPDREAADQLGFAYVGWDELLAGSDIVSLHAPLLPDTKHMIDDDAIARMKPGVMIVNTSRGGLIDTRALIEGLKSGRIGSAGLDVYEEEHQYFFEDYSGMIITDDILARLLTFNNVLVTSHQAFLTRDALGNIADTTLAGIEAYRNGKRGDDLPNHL